MADLPGFTLGVFASKNVFKSSLTIHSLTSLIFAKAFSAEVKGAKAVNLHNLLNRDKSVTEFWTSFFNAPISSASEVSNKAYPNADSHNIYWRGYE